MFLLASLEPTSLSGCGSRSGSAGTWRFPLAWRICFPILPRGSWQRALSLDGCWQETSLPYYTGPSLVFFSVSVTGQLAWHRVSDVRENEQEAQPLESHIIISTLFHLWKGAPQVQPTPRGEGNQAQPSKGGVLKNMWSCLNTMLC